MHHVRSPIAGSRLPGPYDRVSARKAFLVTIGSGLVLWLAMTEFVIRLLG